MQTNFTLGTYLQFACDATELIVGYLLMTADGCPTQEILQRLKVSAPTLNLWLLRYLECGIEGLSKGKTRPSRLEKVHEVLTLTMTGKLAQATYWSCQTLAKQVGISRTAVHRIWRAATEGASGQRFKVSSDPQFEEKLRDVVGLYLDSPVKAIVFSVDAKTEIQALDRTPPALPMKRIKSGTMTHDSKCQDTTTLFAALYIIGRPGRGESRRRTLDNHHLVKYNANTKKI